MKSICLRCLSLTVAALVQIQDERFLPEFDKRTGYVTQSILCLPILSRQGNVLGVAEMVNKKSAAGGFTSSDEQVT